MAPFHTPLKASKIDLPDESRSLYWYAEGGFLYARE